MKKHEEVSADLYFKIKESKVFTVGINTNSKPFAYINEKNDTLEGFDVDLIKLISSKIFGDKVKIKFVSVRPSDRILRLNSGEIDVIISTMTITHERLRIVDFSKPYFMTGQAFLVKSNSNIRVGKDLNNKKVGIVLGTTASDNLRYIASKANLAGFKNYKDAFKALQDGKVDAISSDEVILKGISNENKTYKVLPDKYSTEFYGIALRKDTSSKYLKQKINSAISEAERNNELEKLEHKYDLDYIR